MGGLAVFSTVWSERARTVSCIEQRKAETVRDIFRRRYPRALVLAFRSAASNKSLRNQPSVSFPAATSSPGI